MYSLEDGSEVEVYYEDDGLVGKLQYHSGLVFAHVDFKKNTPEVHKRFLEKFEECKEDLSNRGYDTLFTYTRNKRFAKYVPGATYLTHFNHSGKDYEVWKWELKQH